MGLQSSEENGREAQEYNLVKGGYIGTDEVYKTIRFVNGRRLC